MKHTSTGYAQQCKLMLLCPSKITEMLEQRGDIVMNNGGNHLARVFTSIQNI